MPAPLLHEITNLPNHATTRLYRCFANFAVHNTPNIVWIEGEGCKYICGVDSAVPAENSSDDNTNKSMLFGFNHLPIPIALNPASDSKFQIDLDAIGCRTE